MSSHAEATKHLEGAIEALQEANDIDGVLVHWVLSVATMTGDGNTITAHMARTGQPAYVSRGLILNTSDQMREELFGPEWEDE